jgi:hypothetical protein
MKVSTDALRLLDSCNDSDTCIESKLLPPDLLSCEDETSPKNARNDMAFHMFRSDDANNNSFEKFMPTKGLSSCNMDNDEGNTSASSTGNYQHCGNQMQVSEFKVLVDEHDSSNCLSDKQSSPTTKYSSIFSECLFA